MLETESTVTNMLLKIRAVHVSNRLKIFEAQQAIVVLQEELTHIPDSSKRNMQLEWLLEMSRKLETYHEVAKDFKVHTNLLRRAFELEEE